MNKIIKLMRHPLISGSSVILIGSLFANVINYLFNLAMGRLLLPAEYGLVTSLISLTILFAIFQASMTTVFAKFAAKFKAKNDNLSRVHLIKSGFRFILLSSSLILFILLLLTQYLSNFLHISDVRLILLTDLYVFFSVIISLPNGIFQGEVRVYIYTIQTIVAAFLKIIIGVLLVLAGYKVLGAMVGISIAGIVPSVWALLIIFKGVGNKDSKDKKVESLFAREFKGYSVYFFLATLGITIFTSADTILARHFLPALLAGQYAALSLMGKAIFYVTFPIYFVFFPLVAQRKEKKENVREILMLAAFVILLISMGAVFFYFFLPGFVLAIFFPKPEYRILAPLLGPYSLFIIIFSFASLLSNFLLSIGRVGVYKINLLLGIVLIGLICFFHANLMQIIIDLSASSFLLLLLLFIYYIRYGRD